MITSLKFLWVLLLMTSAADVDQKPNYRLPTNIKPIDYKVNLEIKSLENNSFLGEVFIIFISTKDGANSVKLHSSPKYIKFIDCNIKNILNTTLPCDMGVPDEKTDILKISFNTTFEVNQQYQLHFKYKANFTTDDMEGFYKSTYSENGTSYILAATQFEPTHARRAFPCFDEPKFKATFRISIKHPNEYIALSNTPATTALDTVGTMTTTTFQKTPPMSTYLVAFIVSHFEFAAPHNPSTKYSYRVYARKGAKEDMAIATEYGTKLIDTMGEWIGMPYETLGNKQVYQVAIPDFAAGAMENWGLITYREVTLLDEGEKTSNVAKQRIITVIAHELSHQWFGDYVTTDWWSNLWLNEGFATYFESHLPSKVLGFDEDFELEKQFLLVVQMALKSDADSTSQPLSDKSEAINTLAEINLKFDDITYLKGGSIVRMMSYIIGQENFQKGLKGYLNDNHTINKSPENLLKHLQSVSTGENLKNLKDKMHHWIHSPGFPLVTATLADDKILLTQERFNNLNNSHTEWSIPISYASSENPNFNFSLVEWMETGAIIDYKTSSWIIFNVQAVGFYRVNYDETLWDKIIEALNGERFETIDILNRAQLIDDIYSIARIGKVPYKKAFELTEYLRKEKEFYPWLSAFNAFEFLLGKLDNDYKNKLKSLILSYINESFDKKDSNTFIGHVGIMKNVLITSWSCKLGKKECISFAKKEFDNYKKDPSKIDRNFRGVILCYGLRHSETVESDFHLLFENFKKSPSSIEQTAILVAMGCMDDEKVLMEYLDQTIKPKSDIRKQDAATVFEAVYSKSEKGLNTALSFLDANFGKVEEAYKGLNSIARIVTGMAEDVTTDAQRKMLVEIINKHKENDEIKLIRARAMKIMEENKKWSEKYESNIKEALNKWTNGAENYVPVAVILLISITTLFANVLNFFIPGVL